ncbi:MAG: hypothetical protein ABIU06_19555 [Anaerolineales bacterium]
MNRFNFRQSIGYLSVLIITLNSLGMGRVVALCMVGALVLIGLAVIARRDVREKDNKST